VFGDSARAFFPKSNSYVIAALSFHHYHIVRLQHCSMNFASLELFSEQPSLFGFTLIHGFQVFAVPAANKLPETHHHHKLTSKKNSIYWLRRNDNSQRRESKVKLEVSYRTARQLQLVSNRCEHPFFLLTLLQDSV